MCCDPECSTCERLQGLAVELVADGGAEALSFEALSERSGLPPELIAEHYPTPGACLYAPYETASGRVLEVLAGGFGAALSWHAGFARATRELVAEMAADPAQAKLCFVVAPRVDHELRTRCEGRRRLIVAFLAAEYERRRRRERLSEVQIELLVGASFHAISEALAAGAEDELAELAPKLGELAGLFDLAAAA
jgi:hypothetical protein